MKRFLYALIRIRVEITCVIMGRQEGGLFKVELQSIGQALSSYVRPGTFPLAIKMVSSDGEIPEKARMPKRDLGTPMPVCQGIGLARRYGWVMAMGAEDMLCPPGAVTLGLLPAKAKFLDGSFKVPPWVKDQEVRARIMQSMPRLEEGKYSYLVASPLERAGFEPQVILIYGNPAQIARLIQATIWATGESVTSSSFGALSCAEEITRTILTDRCQYIVAGGGNRLMAGVHDDEISFALPISKAEAIIVGLEESHKHGMRYPTPTFLTYKAEFPPSFAELIDYLS